MAADGDLTGYQRGTNRETELDRLRSEAEDPCNRSIALIRFWTPTPPALARIREVKDGIVVLEK